jgi:2-phospho-L-lactate guanylyltransferase
MRPIILIPCKPLAEGKSRLSPILSGAERAALCKRFLLDTLALACAVTGSGDIRVVSSDRKALQLAAEFGVRGEDDPDGDLNTALARAVECTVRPGSPEERRDVLVLPIDLVLATPVQLTRVLAFAGDLVLTPDRAGHGTNLLRVAGRIAPNFRFQYGENSISKHLAEARRLDLRPQVLRDPELGLDVDTPTDYTAWVASRAPAGQM